MQHRPIQQNPVHQNGGWASPYPPAAPVRQVSTKKRGVMLALWLFLGIAGVHWFYSGRIGKGVLYLFTMGLFGFGWLWDFFAITFGKPLDRNGLPIEW